MHSEETLGLWKLAVSIGGVLVLAGTTLLAAGQEHYGAALLTGGMLIVLLGWILAVRKNYEWGRPPRLPSGLSCSDFPIRHCPSGSDTYREDQSLGFSWWQELTLNIEHEINPPDLRVECDAEILAIEARVWTLPPTAGERECIRYDASISEISLHFPPLEPMAPKAGIDLKVYSHRRIRVRRIRSLKTTHPSY